MSPDTRNTRDSKLTDPLLELLGSGREIWADEHAHDYVRRLREDWEFPAASER